VEVKKGEKTFIKTETEGKNVIYTELVQIEEVVIIGNVIKKTDKSSESFGMLLALGVLDFTATDAAIPDPTDAAWPKWAAYGIADLIAVGYISYWGATTDSFAQHGKNNGKETDIETLRAKKEAGTLTNLEKQKLKRHEKNTKERPSRQSKDEK